ncbi:polysaccharide deacetylase family protein [Mucilaginibacter gotjawali]|uniref:Peptidoglycan/xylan/chitin deacetylase (PgdA/CDA1 family) n=1 Tax=Mucilaginibacter gotjawali TaxID=1550579 RepID=A0A839SCJ9_9SPHI|nr:polysaccharide deacetylase family protein [Mucilaginibacter gotjawali]MBB3055042.1 peptidoglycan/xylan/chitin deacetylase (PgdA/CDA1 family) [Mucilaginibacter gotjawali]
MLLIKTPKWLKILYPKLLWDANAANRCIYLTFDDGPIPIVTPFVLNILKQYNAKATFFCIGDNVCKHPAIFEQVKNEGHVIGNHTFNHLKGWKTEDNIYLDNFLQADKLLDTKLFRPPYGRIKRSQVKLLQKAKPGIQIVMWSVLSADYDATVSPEQCLNNVIKNTKPGDIVLFHDSLKAQERMEYALPKALEYWSKEGYSFCPLAP